MKCKAKINNISKVYMKETIELRKKRTAVIIDTLKELFPTTKTALNYTTPFEFLVAVILSAQCTDARVNIVTKDLFVKYPTLEHYVNSDLRVFEKDIRSAGFYKNKAKNILATAKIIKTSYKGILPKTMEEMLKLPGVARKTANVVLGEIYGVYPGIAVDTHVKRLSKIYGMTNEIDPTKIEKDLMEIVPEEEWFKFTLRMIDYGRAYCTAKKHDHDNCPLVISLREEGLFPED